MDQERPRRRRTRPAEPEAAPQESDDEPGDEDLAHDEAAHDEAAHDEAAHGEAAHDEAADGEAADDEPASEPEPESPPKRIPARKIARWAAEQVMEMTGKESESVTSVRQTDDGWQVGLEVVETHRIPSSTDILATYEAEMDRDGELISYKRAKRYTRGRGDDE